MTRLSTLVVVALSAGIAVAGDQDHKAHGGAAGAPMPAGPVVEIPYSPELVKKVLGDAQVSGDARRGAMVFASAKTACISCHKVGSHGGAVGPELSAVGKTAKPEEIVESLVWPKRLVKPEFSATAVRTTDGRTVQGYKEKETEKELVLREPGTTTVHKLDKADIDARREVGTLMPDGLWASMAPDQQRDLVRFLLDLGRTPGLESAVAIHEPAKFAYERAPLNPEDWPSRTHRVNRQRLYDFYRKEAAYFMKQPTVPHLLPAFPGIDGGIDGHWGNQNEGTWADDRWNKTDVGSLMAGVFRGAGVTVPRGVCVRLGDKGELAACFNPDTLTIDAAWTGGFVKFSSVRHGFMNGVLMDGKPADRPTGVKPDKPFVYRGFYRHGRRVIFSYRVGDVDLLDAPWEENGKLTRVVAPAAGHPQAALTRGGPAQWPQELVIPGKLGAGRPYAVDTLEPPFENPWNAMMFFAGVDFTSDGTAYVCTMEGDVWRVQGIDDKLERVRWRRFASGLHHALGLVVAEGKVYVLGRDQITRLHDLNDDGEADFYECFCNAYVTSTAGHDFICGLERDLAGNFYTASGNQGLLKISPDGKKVDVLAVGFRNPDGLGLMPDGALTVPCSEGEWTPASMICRVPPRSLTASGPVPHYGYGGPRDGKPPELPLVYVPRGLDNSSGGQVAVNSDRWGPLQGRAIHLSFGTCTQFLLLQDQVGGQAQGAIVPLAGEFLSGAHRGRFNPKDGQLYVVGMGGWGAYTVADGCLHRVRYTGDPVQLPDAFHVHRNGLMVRFTQPVDKAIVEKTANHFAQCWNYRYSAAYGSPEFAPRHPGTRGHESLAITAAHVQADGRSVFLEIPDLQPVNMLHLQLNPGGGGRPSDMFITVHKLDEPFTGYPGYKPTDKVVAAHPLLMDLAMATKRVPNPWRATIAGARSVTVEAGKNLTFATREFKVKAGEAVRFTFANPDVVPHNWVLIKPGSLQRVGDLTNKLIADPEAMVRHYVPAGVDVLAYTDIVGPTERFTIWFRAPKEKGRYPYLCTFPGHWMVMNGEMIVE